jgi:hypothetical protein
MPSSRAPLRLALAVLLALAIAAAAGADDDRPTQLVYTTSGPVPLLAPGYRRGDAAVVRVEDHDLLPRHIRIAPGQTLAWVSASRAPSRIVFESEVARSLVCHGLVNFAIQEDELRSAELHAGEVASFCQLAPGLYRYKVVRGGHDRGLAVAAARRLDGWVLVEDR